MAKVKQYIEKENSTNNTNSNGYKSVDFSKAKIGIKEVGDATLDLGSYKRVNKQFGDKQFILKAIHDNDLPTLRAISDFYYRSSGIYSRIIRYMSNLYKYDWMVVPYVNSDNLRNEKLLKDFNKVLMYLDNSDIKHLLSKISAKVFRFGCYYGYINYSKEGIAIQDLPIAYCRSRYQTPDGRPIVEFNMRFFDDKFSDAVTKMKMLDVFPDEFKQGYILYKQGKLVPDFPGDTASWYMLDTSCALKFNAGGGGGGDGDDYPLFIATIPTIIDLDEAQDLDRKKMQQQLLKIIIQTLPIDKNGDLIFDIDEAQALHNNVVGMLSKAIGVDVLTTFADVKIEDLLDDDSSTSADQLEKIERAVFNESGIPKNVFNSDGNLALDKSVLNDESLMVDLMRQYTKFLNLVVKKFNTTNKVTYKVQLLNTTIYNYKELAQVYQSQTTIGFSKMLPQIALGQSQSVILATNYFENEVLDLVHKFIPPMSSNTMSNDALETLTDGKGKAGRPTKESQGESVSEKTIQNRESES